MPDPMRYRPAIDLIPAVATASGMPADDIDIYIVIAIDRDDLPRFSTNLCCAQHAIDALRDIAGQLEDLPDWANPVRHR